MTEVDMMKALAIGLLGVIQVIFWRWVDSIKKTQDDDKAQIESVKTELAELKVEVHQDFQTKKDARNDAKQIMDFLTDIKSDIRSISNKIDKKADK